MNPQERDLLAAIVEADGCFEAALAEGWLEALADGDIERLRDLWRRRLSYARALFPAALAYVADEVLVSLSENSLSYRGHVVKLHGRQAEVISVLAEQIGHTVTRDTIVRRVFGITETDYSSRSLDQHVMRLRQALRPIGLNIFTTWGRGYRLDVA